MPKVVLHAGGYCDGQDRKCPSLEELTLSLEKRQIQASEQIREVSVMKGAVNEISRGER